jgi:hypothetical protein
MENEKPDNIKDQNDVLLNRIELFKYHKFLSLSKIINIPYKEWIGETLNEETVIINYRNGELKIGAGYSEIKSRLNMQIVGATKNNILGFAVSMHNDNLGIETIVKELKLEWVLPDGYIDE